MFIKEEDHQHDIIMPSSPKWACDCMASDKESEDFIDFNPALLQDPQSFGPPPISSPHFQSDKCCWKPLDISPSISGLPSFISESPVPEFFFSQSHQFHSPPLKSVSIQSPDKASINLVSVSVDNPVLAS